MDSWIDVLVARGRASGLTERDAHELAETLFMLLQDAFLLARKRHDARALTIAADAATGVVRRKLNTTTHNAVAASRDAPA